MTVFVHVFLNVRRCRFVVRAVLCSLTLDDGVI